MSKAKKRRRSNASGTLEKRGNIWFVRYMDVDGKRKRTSTGETDKIKAKTWMDNFMSEKFLTSKITDKKKQVFFLKAKLESEIETSEQELMDMKKVSLDEIYSRLFESEEGKKYRPKDITKAMEGQYRRFIKNFVNWVNER